jgi:transposase
VQLVSSQAGTIERLESAVKALETEVAELKRRLRQHSGNSGKPPSRDPAAERQRQAEERRQRAEKTGGTKRKRGKQPGAPGSSLQMSANPDEIVDHRPERCDGCGAALDHAADQGFQRRQVVEVPEVAPSTTEHRAHSYLCSCGHETTAAFPDGVRAPVSYGPRARAIVAYLLGRHDPVRYRQLVANSKSKKVPPVPPWRRGHPPTLDRPHAERPWRSAS